ncbi:MAG: hypothetical protein PUB96_00585 [Helicobacteraceae bacterium]|nr:hypothetical protein [Helicobacteraceae bacterium]
MANIVLFGGSNSLLLDGFQKGIKDELLNSNKKLELVNLALGGCGSTQILFELVRDKNKKIINEAEYIIIESNINDIHNAQELILLQDIVKLHVWICEILYRLNKKVIFLILPLCAEYKNTILIENLSRIYANYYGFNVIDMARVYRQNELFEVFATNDVLHQLSALMAEIGRVIIRNLDKFLPTKSCVLNHILPEFKTIEPQEFIGGELKFKHCKNSFYEEKVYMLTKDTKWQFPLKCKGYSLLGVLLWNKDALEYDYCSYVLCNANKEIVKGYRDGYMIFQELFCPLNLDENSFIYYNSKNLPLSEPSKWLKRGANIKKLVAKNIKKGVNARDIGCVGIVSFLLASSDFRIPSFKIPSDERLENVESKYDFTHLLPNMLFLKEVILEYCARLNLNNKIGQTAYVNNICKKPRLFAGGGDFTLIS